MTRARDLIGACGMLAGLAGIMLIAYYVGRCDGQRESVDPTVPAPLVEAVAQVRCSMYVAEDLSATWEDGDRARDECYHTMTGKHWFVHWQRLHNR